MTIRCPHCGKSQRIPADRPRTAAAAALAGNPITRAAGGAPDPRLVQAWGQVPDWTDDDAAVCWRPDDSAGNCPSCGRPRVAEPGRTMVCCPPCWDWDDYPEVIAWRELQRRPGAGAPARGAVTLAAQIRAGIGHEVECGRLEREIAAVLAADARLTADCREILSSYIRRIKQARDGSDGPERLAVLRALWEAQPIERRGWRRRFDDTGSYLAWLAEHLTASRDVIEGEIVSADDAGSGQPARPVPAEPDPAAGWWDHYDHGAASAAARPDDGDRSPGWITRRAGMT